MTGPGQAVSYKIGQMEWMDWKTAELVLGDKFGTRQFHEVVIGAAGPLDILD